eukprot:gene5432-8896_t
MSITEDRRGHNSEALIVSITSSQKDFSIANLSIVLELSSLRETTGRISDCE